MTTVVLIRREGPHTVVQTQGTRFVETSVDHLATLQSARSVMSLRHIGTLILEDMTYDELPEIVRGAVMPGMTGNSCPIVTRWTRPDPNA